MYDSRIARWLTVDPAGQYASPYVAMGADPVNGVDPDGAMTDDCPTCPVHDLPTVTVYASKSYNDIVNISRLDGIAINLNQWQNHLVPVKIPALPTISEAPQLDKYTAAWQQQWTRDYNKSHSRNPETGELNFVYPEWTNNFSDRIIGPMLTIWTVADGVGEVRALTMFKGAAKGGENYLYHYTSIEAAQSISQQGLKVGQDGFSYLTNKGNLSGIQAQIELALPANRGGMNPAMIRRVTGNMPGSGAGGGTEFLFNRMIPANRITIMP